MTIMIAAASKPLWCPHPSWSADYTTVAGNEATVHLHCTRCGISRVVRQEAPA